MTTNNQMRFVSKRQKMVFGFAVRLTGSFNVQGSQKPMDSGDYICRVIGGGVDQWLFSATPVPDVVDADALTIAGKLTKDKKGKPAVGLGSLVGISMDGQDVWTGRPVAGLHDDDDDALTVEGVIPTPKPAKVGNGASQTGKTTDQPQAAAGGRG